MKRKKLKSLLLAPAFIGLLSGFLGGLIVSLGMPSRQVEPAGRPAPNLVNAAQMVSPSVVNVVVTAEEGSTMGSGFIHDGNRVLTNSHLFSSPNATVEVTLADGRSFRVSEYKTDPLHDIALLTLQDKAGKVPSKLPSSQLGDSELLQAGQPVLAIGSSQDASPLVVSGVISAVDRSIPAQDIEGNQSLIHLIQTDAPIHLGNSGGPLVNAEGKVIGMNVAMATNLNGIAFAIPANDILEILKGLE